MSFQRPDPPVRRDVPSQSDVEPLHPPLHRQQFWKAPHTPNEFHRRHDPQLGSTAGPSWNQKPQRPPSAATL